MKRLKKVKKTLMIGPQIIVFFMKEILDLIKECRSPWFIYPLVLAFFFSGFAGSRTSNLMNKTCEESYYTYINLKREPIDWERTLDKQQLVKNYLEFTDQEFEVIEEDARRARSACKSGFRKANKNIWKYGLFGWSLLFLIVSALVHSNLHLSKKE